MSEQRYPCEQCGAQLTFEPGTTDLKCQHCGWLQKIPASLEHIEELDFQEYLRSHPPALEKEDDQILHCNSCGAEYSLGPYEASGACPFCGSNVVVPATCETRIAPKSLIPFRLKDKEAREAYRKWVASRFWAPNNLKDLALLKHGLHGIYIPYWTYDSFTITAYTGQRGVHYYRTESYTDSNGNTQTRQVRDTHWYPASGIVTVPFDDVLVLGSTHLPPKFAQAMSSWQLSNLTPYKDDFLSGYQAMRYDVNLEQGFGKAQEIMEPTIVTAIRRDIGGNEQRIIEKRTEYRDVTFKHILLPIWAGSYKYRGKVWQYLVNAQTGEVKGEAPVSPWKVAIAIIIGLLILGAIIFIMSQN